MRATRHSTEFSACDRAVENPITFIAGIATASMRSVPRPPGEDVNAAVHERLTPLIGDRIPTNRYTNVNGIFNRLEK